MVTDNTWVGITGRLLVALAGGLPPWPCPCPGGVSPLEGEVDWVLLVLPVLLFRTVLMMVAGEQVVVAGGGGGGGLDIKPEAGRAKTLATATAGAGRAVITTSPALGWSL